MAYLKKVPPTRVVRRPERPPIKSRVTRKALPKKFKVFLTFTAVTALLVFIFIGYPLLSIYSSAKAMKKEAFQISQHLEALDFEAIQKDLKSMDKELTKLEGKARRYSYLKIIPGTSAFFEDAPIYTEAGRHGLRIAQIAFEELEPHQELLDFSKGETSNKMVRAIRVVPLLLPRFDEISTEFHALRQSMDQIDSSKYPDKLFGHEVRSQVDLSLESINRFDDSMPALKSFLGRMPHFLGDAGTGDRVYMLLFQNNKELRPSGGFLTSYALITFREGNVASVVSADTFDIDKDCKLTFSCEAPNPLTQKYLNQDHWFARDANLSPDYVVSADQFYTFWQKRQMPKVDGIFAMDTDVPKAMLEVLGPVKVEGFDEEFNSSNVIDILTSQARERREMANRKELLGLLMKALEGMIFDAPQEKWAGLGSAMLDQLYQKHLLLYTFDPQAQGFFDASNFSGRVQDAESDYLYINDANFGGGKGDFYITRDVKKEVTETNGQLTTKLTIHYVNSGEFEKELNPGYQSYVRILVPKGSEYVAQDGSQEPVTVSEDLGKTVFTALTITEPKKESSLVVTYKLPKEINLQNYSLYLQKQPGKGTDLYDIKVGRDERKVFLSTDKLLKFGK